MSQLELIENDGITNRFLEWFDENEKPDNEGRRRFFLCWDDKNAFLLPGNTRNKDGSIPRAQAFHANPQEYIEAGFVPRGWAK